MLRCSDTAVGTVVARAGTALEGAGGLGGEEGEVISRSIVPEVDPLPEDDWEEVAVDRPVSLQPFA